MHSKSQNKMTKTFSCYTLLTNYEELTSDTSAYHDMNVAAVVINGPNLQLSLV